jgi:polyadenylate-binding protein
MSTGGRGNRSVNRRNNPGQPSQVQMQDPSIIHVSHAPMMTEFSLQQLLSIPADQQKVALGERLYPLIQKIQPKHCGKITGMFLDSGWSLQELYELLHDENKLNEKVEQAVGVLQRAKQAEIEGVGHAEEQAEETTAH